MLKLTIILYSIYAIIDLIVTILNRSFVQSKLEAKPIILESDRFKEAGRYKIESETLAIYSKIYSYLVFLGFIYLSILLQKIG